MSDGLLRIRLAAAARRARGIHDARGRRERGALGLVQSRRRTWATSPPTVAANRARLARAAGAAGGAGVAEPGARHRGGRSRCAVAGHATGDRRCRRRHACPGAVCVDHGGRLPAGAVREPRWSAHRRRARRLARARGGRARAHGRARWASRRPELAAWLGPAISHGTSKWARRCARPSSRMPTPARAAAFSAQRTRRAGRRISSASRAAGSAAWASRRCQRRRVVHVRGSRALLFASARRPGDGQWRAWPR